MIGQAIWSYLIAGVKVYWQLKIKIELAEIPGEYGLAV
jgi:hypothetical protein